ncbi:glycosyltransferase [Halomonas elongata]|uniref:glycosyltransferase n=1 Tax=Halomonas elongata TaxID=2746 RepID=UPI00186BAC04|nr:glycosyltransferase [Halomonas elongata]MBW5798990.1 hypothetical protein [Halomonas elongata]
MSGKEVITPSFSSDKEENNASLLDQAKKAMADGDMSRVEALAENLIEAGSPQRDAWRLWIKAALRQGLTDIAMLRVNQALEVQQKDPEIYVLEARVRFRLGQRHQALQRIEEARQRWPHYAGLQSTLLDILRGLGLKRPAFPLLYGLRRRGVPHASVMMAAARFYQSHGRLNAAKIVLDRVLKQHPKHVQARQMLEALPLQQIQRAMKQGNLERAFDLADQAVELASPPPLAWQLWVQVASKQGLQDVAEQRAERALQVQPDSPELYAQWARIKNAVGHPNTALEKVELALEHWPENTNLRITKLDLLNQLGDRRSILDMLRQLRREGAQHPGVMMAIARFYQAYNRQGATLLVLDKVLEQQPQNRTARLMRQKVMVARASSDFPASAGLTEALGRARQGKIPSSTDLAELLQALKLVTTSELNTSSTLMVICQEAITLLSDNISRLTEQETLDLFNQAERFGHGEAAHRSLRRLFTDGPRTPGVANALFDKAMASVEPHQADAVAARLLRYVPQAQRVIPEAEFALRLHGPQSASACLRQERRKQRSLPEARKLIKFVQLADLNGLGLRYVRFCRRRWPHDVELRLQQARLLMNAGFPREALDVLNSPMPAAKRLPVAQIRVHCWLELGDGETALAELDRLDTLTDKMFELRLQILVMLGRAEDAQALIQEARHRGVVNRMTSGHFSISLLGHHLNDLMLLRNEQRSLPPGDHAADLMARYHHPAMEEIRRQVQPALPDQEGPRCIPLQVVQYWDQRHPPDSVMEIMLSWSSLPQVQYERFDSQKARSFLRRTFGSEYARAYGLANNLAEAADFFRLCYLRHHGGLYADADDRLHGQLEALIPPGVGLVCYRESFGALANNVIAATPGHPAIVHASEMAAEALLARDNDSTWSKTGPGLFTRAVAYYLATATPTSAHERVAVLPLYRLRRQVQIHMALPHKKTKQYWNTTRTTSVDVAPYIMEQQVPDDRAS